VHYTVACATANKGPKELPDIYALNRNLYFTTSKQYTNQHHKERQHTTPSGCSFITNFFRLKHSFRIFAHENELILATFWKMIIPTCETASCRCMPSWSCNSTVCNCKKWSKQYGKT